MSEVIKRTDAQALVCRNLLERHEEVASAAAKVLVDEAIPRLKDLVQDVDSSLSIGASSVLTSIYKAAASSIGSSEIGVQSGNIVNLFFGGDSEAAKRLLENQGIIVSNSKRLLDDSIIDAEVIPNEQ
jgi:hypothetical protein